MAKKRERLEVIHDILSAIQAHEGIGTAQLIRASNLSPQMFRDYCDELLAKRFLSVCEEGNSKTFSLTDRGYGFLSEYAVVTRFIDRFGL